MRADNSQFLLDAAAHRRAETARRAAAAIRRLDAAGQPITFASVATLAGVSRSWLYRDQTTRAEVERLRQTAPAPAPPSAQRGSIDSWRQRYETVVEANRNLTQDNQRLRDQVAALLGEQRTNRTRGPYRN